MSHKLCRSIKVTGMLTEQRFGCYAVVKTLCSPAPFHRCQCSRPEWRRLAHEGNSLGVHLQPCCSRDDGAQGSHHNTLFVLQKQLQHLKLRLFVVINTFLCYRALTPPTLSSPGSSRKEITEHWEWLEHNLLQTLSIFENENDITTFVKGKVQVIKKKTKRANARLEFSERTKSPHVHLCPRGRRGSSPSPTRTTMPKRTTTRTSSRRPALSSGSCLGCRMRRSWSTITPAATGRAKSRDRDGCTSASTTCASTPTYWEKKVRSLIFHSIYCNGCF